MAKREQQPATDGVKVYRRFIYLDGDQVLSALSGLGIDQVDEVFETSVTAGGGDFRAGIAVSAAQIGFSRGRKREIQKQLTRRQTIHSWVNVLLATLKDNGGLAQLDPAAIATLTENKLVQFDADIDLLPLPGQEDLGGLLSTGDERSRLERILRRSQAIVAAQKRARAYSQATRIGTATLCLPGNEKNQADRLVLYLQSRYLLITSPAEFSRRATIVAQVEVVTKSDEQVTVEKGESYSVAPRGASLEPRAADGGAQEDPGRASDRPATEFRIVMRPLCIFK
jgi:hypothetical protein